MQLLFLYGPPATGKLTIAKEVAKATGFKLFHNHLTQDLAREIYADFGPERFGLVTKLRLEVFKYAAQHDTDLIFTFVFDGDDIDTKFMDDVYDIVRGSAGEVKLVHLTAPIETLKQRVVSESRREFHKIQDPDKLEESITANNTYATYPDDAQLELDTSLLSVEESAAKIVAFLEV